MSDKGLATEMGEGLLRQAREDLSGVMLSRAQDRPAFRAMEAVDASKVQTPERTFPGLGPTVAEVAAQRHLDAEKAIHLPERREIDRTPVVGTPEQMSSARNAELFPRGTDNDNER
jgi:hypothetical protein